MAEVILGTGEDGADVHAGDNAAKFLLHLRQRQEATWAVGLQGRVVVTIFQGDWRTGEPSSCTVYLPEKYRAWWDEHSDICWSAIRAAAHGAWDADDNWCNDSLPVDWMLEVPSELQHFVVENTARPMPRRYNTTAMQLHERDGVAWLTFPEAKLYDVLKQTNWLFIPQPCMVRKAQIRQQAGAHSRG